MFNSIPFNDPVPIQDNFPTPVPQFEEDMLAMQQEIPVPEQIVYEYWYQKDQVRLNREIESVKMEFPDIECIKINDGRIVFKGELDNQEICLICDYNYPLKPPDILLFDVAMEFVDENNSFNLFHTTDFSWEPNNSYVVDVIRALSNFLKMYFRIKETTKENFDTGEKNESTESDRT